MIFIVFEELTAAGSTGSFARDNVNVGFSDRRVELVEEFRR